MRLRALINSMQQRLGVAREEAAEASPEIPPAAASGTLGYHTAQPLSWFLMGTLQTGLHQNLQQNPADGLSSAGLGPPSHAHTIAVFLAGLGQARYAATCSSQAGQAFAS